MRKDRRLRKIVRSMTMEKNRIMKNCWYGINENDQEGAQVVNIRNMGSKDIFTRTEKILARSLANVYCQ